MMSETEDKYVFYFEQAKRLKRLGWEWEDVALGHRRNEQLMDKLEAWSEAGQPAITVEEWQSIVRQCQSEEEAKGIEIEDEDTAAKVLAAGGDEGQAASEAKGDLESEFQGEGDGGNASNGEEVNEQPRTEDDDFERVCKVELVDPIENLDSDSAVKDGHFASSLEKASTDVKKLLDKLDIFHEEVAWAWLYAWKRNVVAPPPGYGEVTRNALEKWLSGIVDEESAKEDVPSSVTENDSDAEKDEGGLDVVNDTAPDVGGPTSIQPDEAESDTSGEELVAEARPEVFQPPVAETSQSGKLCAGLEKVISLPGGASMTLVRCPAGHFKRSRSVYETKKLHLGDYSKVQISEGFWMAKYPVTQAQWRSVMGTNPSYFPGDDNPVDSVSWGECLLFCQKAGLRLPTEAEWEYACRAGNAGEIAGTGQLDQMGWHDGNAFRKTHPVGKKEPNKWGLYDMHGNVSEWCADQSSRDPNKEAMNPDWPEDKATHLTRGGNWSVRDKDKLCNASERLFIADRDRHNTVGFRPVLNLQ